MSGSGRFKVYVIESADKGFVFRWKDRTGRWKQQKSDARTRRAAERAARDLEDRLQKSVGVGTGSQTWEEFCDRYSDGHLSRTGGRNVEKWLGACKHFNAYLAKQGIERLEMQDIRRDLVSGFEGYLFSIGHKPATVNSYMRTFNAGLSYAAEIEWMQPLPPKRKRRTKDSEEKIGMKGRPVVGEEVDRMVLAAEKLLGDRASGFVECIKAYWLGGLRRSEVLDFHWIDHSFHVPMGLDTDFPRIAFSGRQKSGETGIVAIAPEFAEFLRSIRRNDGFVFNPLGITGERLKTAQSVGRVMKEISKKARVVIEKASKGKEAVYATPQNLRQGFGTRWSILVTETTLQHMMRHADIKTTRKYYLGRAAEQATKDIRFSQRKSDFVDAETVNEEIRSL